MTTARTTRGEGTRYRIDRPTFAGIMRDPRIPGGAIWEPGTGFPASTCRQLTQTARLEPLEEALRAVVAGRASSPTHVWGRRHAH
ncbi:hypothetical protein SGFS_099320 [Streptomyces graminofaciens]|uniref:Uncharacterized protein n=1 Tax=Streptomyces graminofaciens TaxID=68212 RepID=A0ABN5W3C8_9ACTN|nr:hypothetical protein [Streptomyces graminofaciens]BBC38638.1 hypothetical protein SGFS_099320 [Streptomyces graminofaciens]